MFHISLPIGFKKHCSILYKGPAHLGSSRPHLNWAGIDRQGDQSLSSTSPLDHRCKMNNLPYEFKRQYQLVGTRA